MASTVIITGASQGIGKATALLFARNGYDLVLAARQRDRLEAVASEIQALGRQAIAVPTDVRDPHEVQTLIDKSLEYYGAIDVLINNAGVYSLGPVEEFSLEDWHQVVDTNLWGYIHTIHALLPHFLERGKGTIVNVGSIGGKIPLPYHIPYTTTKYAVTGLTEALHGELDPKGIHVCAVHPNLIKSSFLDRAIFQGKDEENTRARQELIEKTLEIPFVEKPEDVAEAIWDGVQHQRSEVIVGLANLSQGSYRLFPGLMHWLFRRTFGMKEANS